MVRCSSVFEKGLKIVGPVAHIFTVTWLSEDVKEPTHLSQKVGHKVSGVLVWPCFMGWCFT